MPWLLRLLRWPRRLVWVSSPAVLIRHSAPLGHRSVATFKLSDVARPVREEVMEHGLRWRRSCMSAARRSAFAARDDRELTVHQSLFPPSCPLSGSIPSISLLVAVERPCETKTAQRRTGEPIGNTGSHRARLLFSLAQIEWPEVSRVRHPGPVAQRLEQGTHNPLVGGSNPSGPTISNH